MIFPTFIQKNLFIEIDKELKRVNWYKRYTEIGIRSITMINIITVATLTIWSLINPVKEKRFEVPILVITTVTNLLQLVLSYDKNKKKVYLIKNLLDQYQKGQISLDTLGLHFEFITKRKLHDLQPEYPLVDFHLSYAHHLINE